MRPLVLVSLGFVIAMPVPVAAGTLRQVFYTSVTGNANLSSWADAGGETGVAAGDAICQARAATAGLPNASGYRAWLSDAADDAYCRLHGLAGKKASHCGEPTLPAAAGPWVRRDGLPFGGAITELLPPDQIVFYPARRNEFGATVSGSAWTGTDPDGEFADPTCTDWTSNGGGELGWSGHTDRGSVGWGTAGSNACADTSVRLLCFETGVGEALPAVVGWGRLAFVTSVLGNGNLSSWPQAGGQTGLAAGDEICRNLAADAALPNATSFKAWLSVTGIDARDRFAHDGPWMRLDRLPIATNVSDLTDGSLAAALNLSETGVYLSGWDVWTGTETTGTAAADRCDDWTDDTVAFNGRTGQAWGADHIWTALFPVSCNTAFARLYCLQDLPLLFGDGFESGNTLVWTSTVP